MKRDLLLVELPKSIDQNKVYYAVGFYNDNGDFCFYLIHESIFITQPIRTLPAEHWVNFKGLQCLEKSIKIIGNIENLP